jgi:4-aminobutyrate aminotransferase-like enzyme
MKRKIAEAITSSFFNTFGGNPLVCAYATAALRTLKEENYAAHNEQVGNELVNGLRALQKKYPIIGDVRGRGFMVAAEFVSDKEKKTPITVPEFNKVMEALRERGLLVGRGGGGNVMRLQGPYSTTSEDIQYFLHALEESIKEVY